MHSIRRRLSLILTVCTITAVIMLAFFVNFTVHSTFQKYISDNQDKRNARIVEYFQEIYKTNKKWTPTSGEEMMHEAYMGNYCLTLLDANKNVVWGMNSSDILEKEHLTMQGIGKGVYTTNTFDIKLDGKIVGYVSIGQYFPVLLSQEDVNFQSSINKSIIIGAVVTIIIAVFISIFISKQFSDPITEVSETSVELSKGNYECRSNIKSNIRELSNLITSINTLGNQLDKQGMLRKRLVSDISHEIRTPLNVLQNNLEAMIDGVLPVNEERLNSLNEEVIRFGKLLDNLNTLKQFEGEELKLNFEKVYLNEIVLAVVNDFSMHAKNKNINIALETENESLCTILGDSYRLKQVFINLISNAIKFTSEGGHIYINISNNKDKIIVQVQDDGIGIKKEDLPYIFERLYRGDKSRHEIEGSGIGLTITKKILSLHSASIEVESMEEKGAKFILYFNKIS